MKTLLIDNYDSFTFNLFQLLGEVNGEPPEVVRNDEASWDELARRAFDNVVISPGPGRPDDPADFGICAEAIRRAEVPLLGVCLGHQGICWVHGARIERAPQPAHGRISVIAHGGSPLLAGIPDEFEAVRYHSLHIDPATLPEALEPLAWTDDGVLMAVAHRARPLWGVQFHPESVATEHGHRLLANFRDLTRARARGRRVPRRPPAAREAVESGPAGEAESDLRLLVERLDVAVDPEAAFVELYATSPNAFWLDSARVDGGARFSFAGDASGPFGRVVTYDVEAHEVRVARGDVAETHRGTLFDYLHREQARLSVTVPDGLPFEFTCGFAGYLGYELKADCGGDQAHSSALPDAALLFAGRMLAFDHREGQVYLLCLADATNAEAGRRWIEAMSQKLAAIAGTGASGGFDAARDPHIDVSAAVAAGTEFALARSRERYLEDIAICRERLLDGESYEICLTNSIETEAGGDPLSLYRRLRRVNPAPFAAYLRLGDLAVLSSSPERFLRISRDGLVEAKPIKGTASRGATPSEDARLAEELRTSGKNRSENLMITDLLRNDLGRVCEIGTVAVPRLMEVETYATVHQLVTTVRGRLRPDLTAIDCVRSCFPPGSMTGAPKLRTMAIIDALEEAPRGVYSGAIGYFGVGGGCDLSVTIRTIVVADGRATVGVGGAIVAQSDPDDEYRETLLKGEAPLRAIRSHASMASATAGSAGASD